jgi:hypothetical protein
MSTDPVTPNRPRPIWAVYYVDRRITVTSWHVETPDGSRYMTPDLDGVLRVFTYAHSGRSLAMIGGAIEIAAAVPVALAFHAPAALLVALVALVAAAGVAVGVLVDARRNPRWMELRATYRGHEVVLFTSHRLDEFERVRFALIRALQNDHDVL